MSKLEDKAADALDGLSGFAAKLAALGEKITPDVWLVARESARFSALNVIVEGFALALLAILLAALSRWFYRRAAEYEKANKHCEPIGHWMVCGVAGFFGIALLCVAVADLTNTMAWASLWQPEIWIAKSVFKF